MKKFLKDNVQLLTNIVLFAMWCVIIIVDIITKANPYVISVAAVLAICFGVLIITDISEKTTITIEKKLDKVSKKKENK